MTEGLILVDKPTGWTSFDVVNYTRKIVAERDGQKPKTIKVGHSGTLDPFASGLLIVLIGKKYTTQAATYTKLNKVYEVTMKLGFISSTGDSEGEITTKSQLRPSSANLQQALINFTGVIKQTPPAYSAIKINGKRAYQLARAGQNVKLEPRSVTVKQLELISYNYPYVKLVAEVSSGTYIRSLVEDIGEQLGCSAYTQSLRRTQIDKHKLTSAVKPTQLNPSSITNFIIQT
jgi:tRNA pseudouridine55 synthase